MSLSQNELIAFAAELRRQVIGISYRNKIPHLGSSLSTCDLLTVLYNNVLKVTPDNAKDQDRDRFILSKGHAAAALYSVLALKGFIGIDELKNVGKENSDLEEHPVYGRLPGIEAATGSLGHGLAIGNGLALAAKIKNRSYKSFILMSDGECNEGSVWESALFAAANKLDNLCAIVDFNKWQATGRSQEVLKLDPLTEKFRAFGWLTTEIDGHDTNAIEKTLRELKFGQGQPLMIIAHTVKGRGISFMEDDNNWHYRIPNEEEYAAALHELKKELAA